MHAYKVCDHSPRGAARISEQVRIWTHFAPLFYLPSAIVALRPGILRGSLPRPLAMRSILSGFVALAGNTLSREGNVIFLRRRTPLGVPHSPATSLSRHAATLH